MSFGVYSIILVYSVSLIIPLAWLTISRVGGLRIIMRMLDKDGRVVPLWEWRNTGLLVLVEFAGATLVDVNRASQSKVIDVRPAVQTIRLFNRIVKMLDGNSITCIFIDLCRRLRGEGGQKCNQLPPPDQSDDKADQVRRNKKR
jgi:hypothetical protein